MFLMNFFDRSYIKFTMVFVGASILFDILWLILYTSSKWNPSTVSNNAIYQVKYMRFIVFFTIILIPIKLAIVFILNKYRNRKGDEKYMISLGVLKIFITPSESNPIS
jgi:TRAP-type C4-dicarboxylate transport system permease small subunit